MQPDQAVVSLCVASYLWSYSLNSQKLSGNLVVVSCLDTFLLTRVTL
jgi:hypothetical protein